MRIYKPSDWDRLHERAQPYGDCLLYGKHLEQGYGRMGIQHDDGHWSMVRAHTVAWEMTNGPVPAGKILDHLCHDPQQCAGGTTCLHRACIVPSHMAPVSRAENNALGRSTAAGIRRTVCRRGLHPLDEANTYLHGGKRACRTCRQDAVRRYQARRKG